MKENNFEELELLFGNLIQGKMEGLLGEIIIEAAKNKCMLGKVYEITSSCKANILYLSKIPDSQIVEEVCVGTDVDPQKLLTMPKDDLIPIQKKYFLMIGMENIVYPDDQYSFNKNFDGYVPATWLEINGVPIHDSEIKKRLKLNI